MITVKSSVQAPLDRVWEYWTQPQHIQHWNFASDDWHSPSATNNLVRNGKFSYRMEAKDGSMGFDFEGTYDEIQEKRLIRYTTTDGRKVSVSFSPDADSTVVEETFEAETLHSRDLQQQGWQAILNNFKMYVESGQ